MNWRDRRWAWAAAVAALAAYAFDTRARFLFESPYPLGIDGYFYAVQVRELVEHGRLNYAAAPGAFAWLAPFAAVWGVVDGIKIGTALGSALAVVPAYLLGRRVSGERGPALLGAALVATSASSSYLTTEFVKQGLGLTVLLGFLAALAAALERPTRGRAGLALGLLAAALVTHKTAFVLALALGAPAALVELRRRRPRWVPRALLGALGLVGIVAVLGWLAPERFPGPRDLAHLGALLRGEADWELPVLAYARLRLLMEHEVAIAGALALAALVLGRRATAPLALAPALLALCLAIPWLDPSDPQGAVFRLRLCVFVTLPPLAAFVAARVLDVLGAETRMLVALGAALGLVLARPTRRDEGVQRAHPALVTAVRALEGAVPPGSTVITNDRQVAFMARWYARQPMRLHPPATLDPARTYRLVPFGRMHDDLPAALDALRAERPAGVPPVRELHPFMANGLVLVPEATFQWLMTRVHPSTRARYVRWDTT